MNNPYMKRHRDEYTDDRQDTHNTLSYNDPTATEAIRNITRRERPRPYGPRWTKPRTH